jgi:hypothetical protein
LSTPTPTPTTAKTREDEKKKKKTLPQDKEKEEEREGLQQLPTCSTGQHRLRSLASTKLLSGPVQPAVPMGLPELLTVQFIFSLHPNNSTTLYMRLPEKNMIVTFPSLIAAGIATAVVTGGITGTAVYLTAGDADVVTGDQIKTEGGPHILDLGHMEPWAIAMMCATLLIGMGTCGACCHKQGKSYVRDKEVKLRDRVLGRAKELVHMGAHGADKLLEDVLTYHDMHTEIVVQKMHQITPPRTGGKYAERPCGNPQCGDCKKQQHIAVGFSSSEQKATIIREPSPIPPSAASSPSLGMDGKEDSSPPRSIAARTPSPPTIVKTLNDPFDNNATKALFIAPHSGKWDPIANGRRTPTDVGRRTLTEGSRGNTSRTRGICRTSQATSQGRRRTTPSSTPGKGFSRGRPSKGGERRSKPCPWGFLSRQKTG